MEIKLKLYGTVLALANMFFKILWVYFIFMLVTTTYNYFANGVFEISFKSDEFLFCLVGTLLLDSFLLNYERIRGYLR